MMDGASMMISICLLEPQNEWSIPILLLVCTSVGWFSIFQKKETMGEGGGIYMDPWLVILKKQRIQFWPLTKVLKDQRLVLKHLP
jgi:hypothetical protein